MADWTEEYRSTADRDERYRLLRAETARLREAAHEDEGAELFDPEEVAATLREQSNRVDGRLVAFVANDFGLPLAFRPSGLDRSAQDEVRQAILEGKYDDAEDLDAIRRALLSAHPSVHKAIVVEYGESIRYHLPEGTDDRTNFLTVREMVGLVDYTTNSAQRDGLSRTY